MHYGSDKIDSNNRSRAPHATQRKASYILVQPVLVDDHSGEAGCRTKEATVSYYPEMALGSILFSQEGVNCAEYDQLGLFSCSLNSTVEISQGSWNMCRRA